MSGPRPFRFGAAPDDEATGREWVEQARRLEGLGYSTLLLPDHFVNNFSPVPALTAAASATTALRLGTMVFDNDFRHPALLAKDAATMDVMSDGRFEPGIGAGWHRGEYAATGIPFDPPAVRVARLEEAVAVLKGLWAGGPFSYDGRFYTIAALDGLPRPVQLPHPPLMIGGGGRRVLRLAAREANIVSFSGHIRSDGIDLASLTAGGVAERLELVRDTAAARWGDLELSNYYSTPAILTDDVDTAVAGIQSQQRERFGAALTEKDVLESPHYLVGDASRMIDVLVERRERFGFSYIVFTDQVETYADVVRALAGT
jgi:probable F420-dependent oxidoreductase